MNKRTIGIFIFSLAMFGYITMLFGVSNLLLFLSTLTLHFIGIYFIGGSERRDR